MEDNHLKSFEVSGFKKFDNLKLEDLGQFNLIIGDNNVGKTSLLEALCTNNEQSNFFVSLGNIMFSIKKFSKLTSPFINQYFNNAYSLFPKKFKIVCNTHLGNYDELELTAFDSNNFSINEKKFKSNKLDEFFSANSIYEMRDLNINIPYIPMGSFYSNELTTLYSNNIQLFVDKKERLLKSLIFLIPKIKNIEVNSGMSSTPILLISENEKNNLSPLATYGEGALKLFRILLSLFSNNSYNRLMIDELDAGIHHSNLKGFTKSLLQVAKEEKKQIFATTHSKECIENFTKALEETGMQDEGRIIHLADTKNGIKAFTMRYAEFENSIMAESEIR